MCSCVALGAHNILRQLHFVTILHNPAVCIRHRGHNTAHRMRCLCVPSTHVAHKRGCRHPTQRQLLPQLDVVKQHTGRLPCSLLHILSCCPRSQTAKHHRKRSCKRQYLWSLSQQVSMEFGHLVFDCMWPCHLRSISTAC